MRRKLGLLGAHFGPNLDPNMEAKWSKQMKQRINSKMGAKRHHAQMRRPPLNAYTYA